MRINSINYQTQKKQSFGAFHVSPKYLDEIHTTIFKNKEEFINDFDNIVGMLTEAQKDNPKCNIELFQGVNPLTGDSCPAMHFVDKYGAIIAQINLHNKKYNASDDALSIAYMCQDANNIANKIGYNFENLLEKVGQ